MIQSLSFFLLKMMNMMMDLNQDDDSDRTENYTPPPLDITNDLNDSSEKENNYKDSNSIKQQSIIVLDESFDQVRIPEQIDSNSFILFSLKEDFYIFFRQ